MVTKIDRVQYDPQTTGSNPLSGRDIFLIEMFLN